MWSLHSYLRTPFFFFSRNSCAEKGNQLCVEQKAGVCEACSVGKELKGKKWVHAVAAKERREGRLHFFSSFLPFKEEKKKRKEGKKADDKSQK